MAAPRPTPALAAVCVGANPVVCTALGDCHDAGTCDPATALCSNPEAADGTLCDDGNVCTQTDFCAAGLCVGVDPVICTALDDCHYTGVCDPATGLCSNPSEPDDIPIFFMVEADTHTDHDEPTTNFGESEICRWMAVRAGVSTCASAPQHHGPCPY